VVGIDPDASMLGRAGRRSVNAPCPVDLRIGSAEDLPLPSEHFDTVVATLVLCTIEYPEVALNEFRRVLKPGGRLVFLEHERSPIGSIARLQDLITPFWMRISGGCHLNRSTTGTISQQGFAITDSWRSRGGQGSLVQGAAQLGQS
jgi:ubiquinone/menaquinone biosynthesis C-methylase UbiE